MNYLNEKELITHCIKCDTALEESESMTCTACSTEYEKHVEEEAVCMFCNQKEDLIQVLYNGSARHTHKECAEVNDDYELKTIESGNPFEDMEEWAQDVAHDQFEECRCCGQLKPDVVLGLCDACDSKYGE